MMSKSLLPFTIYIKSHLSINRRQQVFDLMKYSGNSDTQMYKLNGISWMMKMTRQLKLI